MKTIPALLLVVWLSGCSLPEKPEPVSLEGGDLTELIKAAYKAGCKISGITVDKYLETYSITCK